MRLQSEHRIINDQVEELRKAMCETACSLLPTFPPFRVITWYWYGCMNQTDHQTYYQKVNTLTHTINATTKFLAEHFSMELVKKAVSEFANFLAENLETVLNNNSFYKKICKNRLTQQLVTPTPKSNSFTITPQVQTAVLTITAYTSEFAQKVLATYCFKYHILNTKDTELQQTTTTLDSAGTSQTQSKNNHWESHVNNHQDVTNQSPVESYMHDLILQTWAEITTIFLINFFLLNNTKNEKYTLAQSWANKNTPTIISFEPIRPAISPPVCMNAQSEATRYYECSKPLP